MKRIVLCAAAVILASVGIASAESAYKPPGHSTASAGKCWDTASHTVKDKATQTSSGARQPGGVTTGTGTSGNAVNSTGPALQTRPAGMPTC